MDALERLQKDLNDERLMAFGRAMVRSEQILTGALMAEDCDLRWRLQDDARSIAEEWGFNEELRTTLLELAYENTLMGREI